MENLFSGSTVVECSEMTVSVAAAFMSSEYSVIAGSEKPDICSRQDFPLSSDVIRISFQEERTAAFAYVAGNAADVVCIIKILFRFLEHVIVKAVRRMKTVSAGAKLVHGRPLCIGYVHLML